MPPIFRRGLSAMAIAALWAAAIAPPAQAADQVTIEAAKKEGELIHTDNFFAPETVDRFHKAFRAKYGLPDSFKIRQNTFNSSAVVSRVDQELRAGRVTIDWVMVNAATFWVELQRRGELLEYCSAEYKAIDLAKKASLIQQGCFFQPGAANTFTIVWNPKHIPDEFTSWAQAADPKFAGKVTVGDPRKSEAYLDAFIGLKPVMGIDWFKKIAAQKPFFLSRSTDMRDRAVSGEYPLWYPGFAQRAYQVRDQLLLKVGYPSEGIPIQGMYAGILKKAPHPNAAKLWTDFIFSKEGQELMMEIEAVNTVRSDAVIPAAVKPYMRPLADIKAVPMDWLGLTEETRDKAREEFRDLFGG
jgi:iron(III) transport system substrate-binding protein